MKPRPVQLDYGPQPLRQWRRVWFRGVMILILAIAVILAARTSMQLWWELQEVRESRLAYERASGFQAPQDFLVYGAQADRELMRDSYLHGFTSFGFHFSDPWGVGEEFTHRVRSPDPVWSLLYGQDVSHTMSACLYLGQRQNTRGESRVVFLWMDIAPTLPRPDLAINVNWAALDELDWRGEPKSAPATGTVQLATWPDPREMRTRFYFGAADPDDPSRFSIRYEVGNDDGFEEGFIDGRLEDDLTVTLTVRDGPLLGN